MSIKKCVKTIMIISGLALLAAGCSTQEKEIKDSKFQNQKNYLNMSNLVEADDGAYYVQHEDGYSLLKYVDKKTAKETPLCQKINCKHDSNKCNAVVEEPEYAGFMVYSDEKIYFMTIEPGEGPLKVYCMESGGTNKTLVHAFENQRSFPNQAGIYKEKLFLSVPTIEESEDGMSSTSAEPSVIIYDIKEKEEKVIVDGKKEKGQFIIPAGGSGDSIYLIQLGWNEEDGDVLFKQYNFETEKMSVVYEGSKKDIQFVVDDTIYLQPEGENRLEAYHLQSKERETVFEWEEEVSAVYPRPDHVELMKEVQNGEEVKQVYNWYDLKEKKYLFKGYQGRDEARVLMKMENGYWVQKDNENQAYFYNLQEETWKKIEEIK